MSDLELLLLGEPDVRRGGRDVRFRSRKELALLCYLAVEGGAHTRDRLTELLWPGGGEKRGRAALRNALSGLRRAIAEEERGDYLEVEGERISLNASRVELDLRVVETVLGESSGGSRANGGRGDPLARLQAAVERYRGAFMEGFYLDDAPEFEEWADVERQVWRRRAGTLCDRLAGRLTEAGEFAAAAEAVWRWVSLDPLNEAARLRLMEARAAAGDRAGALEAYEDYRAALSRTLQAEPGPEIEALADRLRAAETPGSRSVRPAGDRPGLARRFHPLRAAGPSVSLESPFVGRSEEFAALVAEYRAAAAGETRAVTVVGESGIGKTRLVTEFLLWAEAQGADVIFGRAAEVRGGLPYGPLVDMMRERIGRERAPDDLLEDVWLSELSRLLPEIRERYPDLPPPTEDETVAKSYMFESVAQLGLAVSGRAPVITFVDDLQWSDQGSLELRRYAGRRWAEEGAPVLTVSCVRQEDLDNDPVLREWLVNVGRDLPLRRLVLGSLTEEDTVEILKGMSSAGGGAGREPEALPGASGRLGHRLHEETHGHPFFLMHTISALVEEGALATGTRPGGGRFVDLAASSAVHDEARLRGLLPTGVREAVRARLSHLSPGGLNLLFAGAVLAQDFSDETLFRVAGLDEVEALDALDETLNARLIQEARSNFARAYGSNGPGNGPGMHPAYDFAHDKVREVVYTEAGASRRRVLHRRALDALEGTAPAAELARHALAGGLPQVAFGHHVAAGDAAMALFAVRDAIGLYEVARGLYEGAGAR